MTEQTPKKFYRLDGFTLANSKRVAKLYFEDLYDRVERNDKNRTHDVFLIKPTDPEELKDVESDIQYFRDVMGMGYVFYWKANA